ncbi:MAG: PHA/PHB synthase family protein, partial [Pseudomonadaceae bacterium]
TGVRGVSRHHENMVTFAGRQWLDMWSPSNFVWTNPEVLEAISASGGANLWRGAMNFFDDAQRLALEDAPAGVEGFEVGKDVAVTPGKVVFRNHLIELIQYTPTTPDVYAEPVLIVPSWIMKYYILDLSPHNSMVKYLVDHGHTVFIISWKNPTAADRDLGLEDYRWLGVMDALDTVTAIVPERKVQAVGYCLGGTLLTIAAAAMARDGDDRLHSLTLLASETDFRESGEIALFIDDSQLAWLEAGMWDKGYLDGKQMAGAFQMLNSRDLIWSRRVREYLLGERQQFNDLMAWNADVTRMPYRMHSEYLRRLYLSNDLAEGRYQVGGRPVAIADIEVPMLIVGTVRDHVAPWPSVYKMHLLSDAELTFVLTSGGHNAGVVSEPGHPRRSYQIATRSVGARYVDPQTWRAETPLNEGSWWPAWQQWLARRSTGRVAPPAMSGTQPQLGDAPGTYVAMR